jgi:hypothetical protein
LLKQLLMVRSAEDHHLLIVYCSIERNPLRAGRVARAEDWPCVESGRLESSPPSGWPFVSLASGCCTALPFPYGILNVPIFLGEGASCADAQGRERHPCRVGGVRGGEREDLDTVTTKLSSGAACLGILSRKTRMAARSATAPGSARPPQGTGMSRSRQILRTSRSGISACAELPNDDCSQDCPTRNGVDPHGRGRTHAVADARGLHAASLGNAHFLKGATRSCHGIGSVHFERFLQGITKVRQ